jgi:hypothetical protein
LGSADPVHPQAAPVLEGLDCRPGARPERALEIGCHRDVERAQAALQIRHRLALLPEAQRQERYR